MSPNDALMELLTMADAAQGASAHRIIAVMPWYGYARQDKKSSPREPITARIVAKTPRGGRGGPRPPTMDLHAGQVQGFFHIPVDHMTAMPMLTQWFADQDFGSEELVIVSPTRAGSRSARTRPQARHPLGSDRQGAPGAEVAEIGYVVGDVKGKPAVLTDDMIDTAGTLSRPPARPSRRAPPA